MAVSAQEEAEAMQASRRADAATGVLAPAGLAVLPAAAQAAPEDFPGANSPMLANGLFLTTIF